MKSTDTVALIEDRALTRFHADASLTFAAARMRALAESSEQERVNYFSELLDAHGERLVAAQRERITTMARAAVAEVLRARDAQK